MDGDVTGPVRGCGIALEGRAGPDGAVVIAGDRHRRLDGVGGAVIAHHEVQIRERQRLAGNPQIAELDARGGQPQAILGQQPVEQSEQVLIECRIRPDGLGGQVGPQRHVAHANVPGAQLTAEQRRERVHGHGGALEVRVDDTVLAELGGVAELEILDTEFRPPAPPLGFQGSDGNGLAGNAGEPDLQIAAVVVGVGHQHPHGSHAQAHGDEEGSDKKLQCAADRLHIWAAVTSKPHRSFRVNRGFPPAA